MVDEAEDLRPEAGIDRFSKFFVANSGLPECVDALHGNVTHTLRLCRAEFGERATETVPGNPDSLRAATQQPLLKDLSVPNRRAPHGEQRPIGCGVKGTGL